MLLGLHHLIPAFLLPTGFFPPEQVVFETQRLNNTGLPVPNPTHSFWIDSPQANPLAKEGSSGPLTRDADVCIIGAGITGVSSAYHLARNLGTGKMVVILEARDFCSGATGRNGGHLTPPVFIGFYDRQQKYGTEEAKKSYALENYVSSKLLKIIKQEGWDEDLDLVEGGRITMFMTEEEEQKARRDWETARMAGLERVDEVRWLEREEMQAKHGTSFPGTFFHSHNLWPLKLVSKLYSLAKSQGLNSGIDIRLHTRTPVTSISHINNATSSSARRWSLATPRGQVNCSYVIHATNAYASFLLPQLRGEVVPTRGQVIAIRPNLGAQVGRSSWRGNGGFEYWFPRYPREEERPLVILGGARDVAPRFEKDETDDSVLNVEVGKALRGFLPPLFPGMYDPNQEVEWEWTGIMGYTTSSAPFVGPVTDGITSTRVEEYEGQYIAAGYTGHGMPRAYACAEVVASMITADLSGRGNEWTAPAWFPRHYLMGHNSSA